MSLAFLGTRGIPAQYGGFETFAEELAVRLAEQGVLVTVYCEKGPAEALGVYRGVKLEYVPATRCGPLTTVLFDLRCLWRARKNHDVVYMLGYGAAVFCFLPRLWGCKVWLNVDGIEWRRAKWGRVARSYFKIMEFFATRVPDRVIADAEGIRQHLLQRHKRLAPCSVIPYGAPVVECPPDADLLRSWGVVPRGYYLVVCRLEPENHVREIIEGFLASETSHPLLIIGDHSRKSDYVYALRGYGSDRVRFLGTIFDLEKLQSLRYHAVAYFHGHSVGGTNPSLLEAMGCGNRVLAHDNCFNREVLGSNGWFFRQADDIPELVRRVEGLSASQSAEMSWAVRERVRLHYSWDRIAADYLRLLESERKTPANPDSMSSLSDMP
ncbi:DUF1972 domain-containing protein [Methylococcus geothermalis]|uniref:DUF1972 domain-containing protein n=1 Tax=Methylococcus geothermalis TaxID=2681310 RepID=A0A858QBW6_9GAMM|nr:DUF1972 domain-containing protein [Methylococcus geothermalis]